MNLKEQLCSAFCGAISVNAVPAGFAVGTGFTRADGDRIGFYVVKSSTGSLWRIEDDGMTVPAILASGADITKGARAEEFDRLLAECGASYDEESQEVHTEWLAEEDLPQAALSFVTLLLKLPELMLLHPERVENAFREDALKAIHDAFDPIALVEEDAAIEDALSEFAADAVIRMPGAPPVAVFLVTSDVKILEAVLLKTVAKYRLKVPCRVAVMMESARPKGVTARMQQRAFNHLDATPAFRGDEQNAIGRLRELATPLPAIMH
jgi:hypothetical protein